MNSEFAGLDRQQSVKKLQGKTLSAGILAAKWLAFAECLSTMRHAGVKVLHFDIMDNHFCPGLTVGPATISQFPLDFIKDVHLMVNQPWSLVQQCVKQGAHIITLQPEGVTNLYHILDWLEGQCAAVNGGQMPILRGLSVCPATPLSIIEPILDKVELIQLLAVEPGYGSKLTVSQLMARFTALIDLLGQRRSEKLIAIDGALSYPLAKQLAELDIDIFVSGSALFANNELDCNLQRWTTLGH